MLCVSEDRLRGTGLVALKEVSHLCLSRSFVCPCHCPCLSWLGG